MDNQQIGIGEMATAEINLDVLRKQIFERSKAIIDAAITEAVATEHETHRAESDSMHADIGLLLRTLGMFDGARPQSSHEVMLEAIASVSKQAGRIEQLRQLAGAMLASFTLTGSGYACRVGQVQIAKWTAILNGEQP